MPSHEPDAAAPKPDATGEKQSPSMSELLAACAAATAVSTPPSESEEAGAGQAEQDDDTADSRPGCRAA
ncbi:MAG TPA: hypothetical protein DEQ61_02840 [Streptomyces sp.]|nr:hypothetical protein [Streptomyces sp.]